MDYPQRTKWLVQTWRHSTDAAAKEEARSTIASLDDLRFLEPVRALLDETRDGDERDTAYWMLESLLRKTGSSEVGNFMMEQVGREKGATVKMNLLRRIGVGRGRGVRIADAAPALDCLDAKMRNLRAAAVEALGSCADPRAEDALIRIVAAQTLKPTENGWFLYEAAHSLSEVATEKALACALELFARIKSLRLGTRKDDVKVMAMRIICRVGGGAQVEVYREALSDGSPAIVKWHAMRALAEHAAAEHAPAIVQRVRTILTSQRVIPQTDPPFWCPDMRDVLFLLAEGQEEARKTELQFAFEALTRLKMLDAGDTPAFLRKHWDSMTEAETRMLKKPLADGCG